MSTPDDEMPEDELEPDDWSEDSSLWGDEPIERPGAFADPEEALEPDDPDEPDDPNAPEPTAAPSPPDEAPSRSAEHFEPLAGFAAPVDAQSPSAALPEPIAAPGPPDEAPSRPVALVVPSQPALTGPPAEHLARDFPEPTDSTTEPDDPPPLDTQVEIDGAAAPASRRPPAEPRPTTPPIEVQVAALLADPSKRIVGDLQWSADEDGAQGREFLAPVRCAAGELRVRGQRCAAAGSLRFSLLSRGLGRIAALDLGHPHQAADGRHSGDTHFHRRDAAEPPTLPTLDPDDIAGAWRLFCALTNITHEGDLGDPPPVQETLL